MVHRARRKSRGNSAKSSKSHKEKISERFESYIELPVSKIDLSINKERRLIDSLDSSLKELELFSSEISRIWRAREEVKKQKSKIASIGYDRRGQLKKYDDYLSAGILGRLIKTKPFGSDDYYKKIRQELKQNEFDFKNVTDKLAQLDSGLSNMHTTIEGDVITKENYQKKQNSINLRKHNAELRLSALLQARSYVQSKEDSIQERETAAAKEVGKYKAYAAAYFDESRKLAMSVKNEMHDQEEIVTGCPYCGALLDDIPHADHIYPITKGGLSVKENMVFVCSKCNLRKSGMTLREFIEKTGLKRTFVETNLKKLGKIF